MTKITVEFDKFETNSYSKSLTSGVSWCITRAHEVGPSRTPISVVCRCSYIMVLLLLLLGLIYQECAHMRARAYTPLRVWLSNRVAKKGIKKNPSTLAYASYGPQGVWKPNDFRHTVVANSWRVC